MTIEVSLLLSGVSIAFAIFFGISTRNRNVKKDTQDEAREDASVLTKINAKIFCFAQQTVFHAPIRQTAAYLPSKTFCAGCWR